ncbi:MAG: MFS transporter [Candidatus Neomarinimicrobiota bacterium]
MIKLLKNRTFSLFFSGNVMSLIGFGFNLIAISWIVLEQTGSEFALGKIMASATAPGLLLALFAGVIIDRLNRKWLLVSLDIFRMLVVLSFIGIYYYYEFEIWMLYPTVFLMGLGNSLFWPTAQAFVQEIVAEEDYFDANKLLSASYQVGSILGASLGGFIVHLFNPLIALWFNVIAYFISGILIALAPFTHQSNKKDNSNLFQSLIVGFKFLKRKLNILTLGTTTILSDVAIWGSLSVLTITISKEIFNKGTWGYGLLDGLYGLGALLSTVLVGYFSQKIGRGQYLIFCYLVAGLTCFIAPIMPSIYYAAIIFSFMGLHNNAARIIIRTIFMENIPNDIMGRVQTTFGVYTRIMVILSALYVGWLIENHSIKIATLFTSAHFTLALIGTIFVLSFWKNKENILNENHA